MPAAHRLEWPGHLKKLCRKRCRDDEQPIAMSDSETNLWQDLSSQKIYVRCLDGWSMKATDASQVPALSFGNQVAGNIYKASAEEARRPMVVNRGSRPPGCVSIRDWMDSTTALPSPCARPGSAAKCMNVDFRHPSLLTGYGHQWH